jgi:DNA mismatch endonuclease, patch repair protein
MAKSTFNNVDKIRSKTMSRIRGKGNKSTEARVRGALIKAGISGWELHADAVEGKPDFYFPSRKLAVFIDGCFWHGCEKCYRRPKSRQKYWDGKVARNIKRDKDVNATLNKEGVGVLRFWEHEVKSNLSEIIKRIMAT